MKYITRTLKSTLVNPQELTFVNGQVQAQPLDSFIIDGIATDEIIIKACRKRYGKMKQYIFTSEVKEQYYRMTVEKFMQEAEEVEKEEAEQEEAE